ncbi:MAG: hypothetical protein QHJ73_10975, partial [Armatimonadota bacterium]|nr:hypothetical protein [Armatimonadota bacterium]
MRWLPIAAAFFVSCALIGGCGSSSVSVEHALRAPVLRGVTLDPASFSFEGGKVTVSANVQSTRPIEAVTVVVTQVQPAGSYNRLYVLESVGGGNYRGEIPLPSNTDPAG